MTFDTATNALMTSIENPILTNVAKIISVITEPLFLLILGLIVAFFISYKYSKRKGVVLASALVVTTFLIRFLKPLIARARPLNSIIAETGFSFPSGHTTMAVVFFGSLAYLFARKKSRAIIILTTLIVASIALTRLYLRVHWLTDIVGGLVLGMVVLGMVIWIDKNN